MSRKVVSHETDGRSSWNVHAPGPRLAAVVLTLLGVLAPTGEMKAQDALVLSTGGSRGLAHAGALVGLQRLGYDPDMVVGGSMGAVMGALYAAGIPPEEIRRRVLATDWGHLFDPRAQVVGPGRVPHFPQLTVGLGLAPLEVTRGFVPDWRVNRLLVHLLFDVGARVEGDFDRLPRRFRAVTTNMESGLEVVMAGGDLARVVRASMAAPGFFSPLPFDTLLLGDGGLSNYLPVSVARGLGAKEIVAVDVSWRPPEPRGGPVAMAGRAISILMHNAVPDTTADRTVRPRIDPDFSSANFPGDPGPLVNLGLRAALDELPRRGPEVVRERTLPTLDREIDTLVVEGVDRPLEALARRIHRSVVPGAYDSTAILGAVDRMYATSLVAGAWPRIERRPVADGSADSLLALVLRVDPEPRSALAGAVGYDNDRGGRVWSMVRRRAGIGGAPLELTAAGAADELEWWVEGSARLHFLPWPPMAWSGGASAHMTEVRTPGRPGDEDREVYRVGGWLGVEFRSSFPDWAGAVLFTAERVDVEDGEDGLAAGPMLRLSPTSVPYPVVGIPARVTADLRFGEREYAAGSVRGSLKREWGNVRVAGVMDLTLASRGAPPDVRPALGDERLMPGYEWGTERGRGRAVVGVDAAHPLAFGGTFLRLRLRVGLARDDLGKIRAADHLVGGAGLEGVWMTPLGPVTVGYGQNTRGERRVDVSVGARF